MLASPRALGFSLSVAALVLGLGWLLPRLGRGPRVTIGAQLVPVLVALALTVLPAFRNVSAADAFPVARSAGSGASVESTESAASGASAASVVVGRGPLSGIDHRASGAALLVRLGDGSLVVRLASLDVEPGPDYQVHLVPGAGRESPGSGVALGALRGNKGNLNYPVPPNASTERPLTLLIWCRAFAVPVAAATIG